MSDRTRIVLYENSFMEYDCVPAHYTGVNPEKQHKNIWLIWKKSGERNDKKHELVLLGTEAHAYLKNISNEC